MFHIILLILKIIGIIILAILGLIIFMLLIILLIPLRYRVCIEQDEVIRVSGRISWLFHILHVRVKQDGEKRRIWLRVFGIIVYDSDRPAKPKRRKRRKRTSMDDGKVHMSAGGKDKSEEITLDATGRTNDSGKITIDATGRTNDSEGVMYTDIRIEGKQKPNKIRRFFNRLKSKLKQIIGRIKRFFKLLFNIKHKIKLIREFLKEEINREGLGATFESLKRLFKHIRPTRLKCKVLFGTGDPCSTGQALGVMGIVYGMYGDNIRITPDFENKIFEGSLDAKGRIRIGTILIIVIKLLFNKKFKGLMSNFKTLKEAL